jgi:lipid A disaccharide synthetase
LAPELIQDAFTSHNLAFLMLRYINDKTLYQETRGAFLELRAALGVKKASHEVAQWAISLL